MASYVDYERSRRIIVARRLKNEIAWLDCLDCDLIKGCPGRCDKMHKMLTKIEQEARN
jgi:radical SAM protein with 4Fe4S-binding SPASM domain